jgi:hypothetical protein
MSIRFSCSCGRKLKVSDEKIGMKVLCSSCGATLKVPKQSQDAYWQDVEKPAAQGETDYAGGLKDILVHGGPGVLIILAMVWGAYYLGSQVISGGSKRPPLGAVTGKITINGTPVENATVRFRPVTEKGAEGGNKAPSQGLTDAQGNYTLYYVRDVAGAAVGEHVVELDAKDSKGKQRFPAEYGRRSKMHKAVKEGSNQIDIDVQMRVEDSDSSADPSADPNAETPAP